MHELYTAGYTGLNINHLHTWLREHNALLVDIRFSPFSRNPIWLGTALQKRLMDRYTHVKAFGNINYNNDLPIALADPAAGLAAVGALLERYPVVLLCACKDHKHCHRLVAADYIAGRLPMTVVHLTLKDFNPDKKPEQMRLI